MDSESLLISSKWTFLRAFRSKAFILIGSYASTTNIDYTKLHEFVYYCLSGPFKIVRFQTP